MPRGHYDRKKIKRKSLDSRSTPHTESIDSAADLAVQKKNKAACLQLLARLMKFHGDNPPDDEAAAAAANLKKRFVQVGGIVGFL